MSERFFRMMIGVILLLILFFRLDEAVYIFTGLFLFEGITNLRTTSLVSFVRYGKDYRKITPFYSAPSTVNFVAERALRLFFAAIFILTFVLPHQGILPDVAWFLPWFLGFMLIGAGITNICPMIILLRWIGFK
jgi:hypothetical protein